MHLQSLKLPCPTVKEEMHLQEIFDLTLIPRGSRSNEALPSTSLQSLKLLLQMVKEMHLQENTLFNLNDPMVKGVNGTHNVAQYPLHHVTYSATKIEVAMYNGLGGDTFTRKYII